MQFRALTEALKDSLNNLDFALGNSIGKLSESFDGKIEKLSRLKISRQPKDFSRNRQEAGACSSDPNRKKRV